MGDLQDYIKDRSERDPEFARLRKERTYGLALATLEAKVTADYRPGGLYIPVSADDETWKRLREAFDRADLMKYPSPIEALAAAATALGLEPVDTTPPGMVPPAVVKQAAWDTLMVSQSLGIVSENGSLPKEVHFRLLELAEKLERISDALSQDTQQGAPSPLEVEASKAGFMLNQSALSKGDGTP